MAQVSDGGGRTVSARLKQYPVYSPRYFGRDEDEEVEQVALARSQSTAGPSLRAAYDDPIMAVRQSIDRIGGLDTFNYRLETLNNEWIAMMGRRTSPSILVDLARSPIGLDMAIQALRSTARTWNLMRHLPAEDSQAMLGRYLELGVVVRNGGAWAKAVDEEIQNSRRQYSLWEPRVTEPINPADDDYRVPQRIEAPFFIPLSYRQIEAWKQDVGLGRTDGRSGSGAVRMRDTAMGMSLLELLRGKVGTDDTEAVGAIAAMEAAGLWELGQWDNTMTDREYLNQKAADDQSARRAREYARYGTVAPEAYSGEGYEQMRASTMKWTGVETAFRLLGWYDEETGKDIIGLLERASATQEHMMASIRSPGAQVTPGYRSQVQARYEERMGNAKNLAAEVYEKGGNIGTYVLETEYGVDPAEHEALAFFIDFTAHAGFDPLMWGGITAGARALRVPQLVSYAARQSGVVKSIAEVVGPMTDRFRISKLTGITNRGVLDELAVPNQTPQQVIDIMAKHVVRGGGLKGTDVGIGRRVSLALWDYNQGAQGPPFLQRMFQTFPEAHLPVHDDEIVRSVEALGATFRRTADDIARWGDEAIAAPTRQARVGILARFYDESVELSGERFKKLQTWWDRRYRKDPDISSGTSYSPTPHPRSKDEITEALTIKADARSTYLMKMRNRLQDELDLLERRETLTGYVKPTDPRLPGGVPDLSFAELRRLGVTDPDIADLKAGRMSPAQAARSLEQRGGLKAGFDIEGTLTHYDDQLHISQFDMAMEDRLSSLVGHPLSEAEGYGVGYFRTKAGATVGAYDYTVTGERMVVEGFGVAENYSRQGIGTRLLSDMLDVAKKKGVGLEFKASDEAGSVLEKMGVPKTLEGYVLSPEQVAEMAGKRTRREAEKLIRDAAATPTPTGPGIKDRLSQIWRMWEDEDLQMARAHETLKEVYWSVDEIAAEVSLIRQNHAKDTFIYNFLKRSRVSIAGSAYHDTSLSAKEIQTMMHGLWSEQGWAEGKHIGATLQGGQKPARRIDDLAEELAKMPEGQAIGLDPSVGTKNADRLWDWIVNYEKLGPAKDLREKALARLNHPTLSDPERLDDIASARDELQYWAERVEARSGASRTARELLDQMDAEIELAFKEGTEEYAPFARGAELTGPAGTQGKVTGKAFGPDRKVSDLKNRIAGIDQALAKTPESGTTIAVPLMPFQLQQYFRPSVPLSAIAMHMSGGPMKWIDRAMRTDVVARTLIGERFGKGLSIDAATNFWKTFLLAAPGIMVKVLADEPSRMLAAGYPITDVIFGPFGRGRSIRTLEQLSRAAEKAGDGSLASRILLEEVYMPRLSYLYEQAEPGVYHAMMGTARNWDKGAQHYMGTLARQRPVRQWLREPGEESLLRWGLTAEGRTYVQQAMGVANDKTIREWAKATDNYLFEFSHYPVASKTRPFGDLTAEEIRLWDEWAATGKKGVPPFDLPSGSVVRNGRIWAPQQDVTDMLKGFRPITGKNLRAIPVEQRPTVAAPKPRAYATGKKRKVMAPIDLMYHSFDTVARNTRKTIFSREFVKRLDDLNRMADSAADEAARLGQAFVRDQAAIWQEAESFARRKVETMTYNAFRTGTEQALRDVMPFLPATRDFMVYWVKESIKHPPLGMALMRLQEMPDETIVPTPENVLLAIGASLDSFNEWAETSPAKEWLLKPASIAAEVIGTGAEVVAGVNWYVNPQTLFFWTGGASAARTADGEADLDRGFSLLRQQFPGIGPMLTAPAELAYWLDKDMFGWIPEMLGFERVGKGIPLNSRLERIIYAGTSLLKALGTGGIKKLIRDNELTDGDWRGYSLPGPLGRDMDLRNRYAADYARSVSMAEGIDWSDPDKAAEQIYRAAMEMVGKEDVMTAVANFFAPGSMWFRNKEIEEQKSAFDAYARSYETTAAAASKAMGITDLSGSGERDRLREATPELAHHFDLMDAYEQRDVDAIGRVAEQYPGVLAWWVSAYNDATEAYEARQMAEAGIDPDSAAGWIWKKEHDLLEAYEPRKFAANIAEKVSDAQSYTHGIGMMQAFEKQMAVKGIEPGVKEYTDAKKEMERKIEELGYRTAPFWQPRAYTPAEKAAQAKLETQNEERAKVLAAQEERELEAALGPNWKARDVDPLYQIIKSEFNQKFEDAGLKRYRDQITQAERKQNELETFISADPWKWQRDDWQARPALGVEWDPDFLTVREQWASVRNTVYQTMKDLKVTSIDSKKMAGVMAGYYDYTQRLCAASDTFAVAWDYYQKQNWERLRDTSRLQTPAWRELFAALSERDGKLLSGDLGDVVAFSMTNPSKAVTPELIRLTYKINRWKEEDPAFAEAFDAFPPSFWNYERRW